MESIPPYIHDADGDVGMYASMHSTVRSLEPQDLEDIANHIVYDSVGNKFILSLTDPVYVRWIKKWNYPYPVSLYQLDEPPKPDELYDLLVKWQARVRNFDKKKNYPQLTNPSLDELFGFAKKYGFIKEM